MRYYLFVLILTFAVNAFGQEACPSFNTAQSPLSACGPTSFTFSVTSGVEGGGIVNATYSWVQRTNARPIIIGNVGPSYTTPILTQSTEYTVTIDPGFGCPLQTETFYAYVPPPSTAPTVNNGSVCGYGTGYASVQYESGAFYTWFDGVTGAELSINTVNSQLYSGHNFSVYGPGNSQIQVLGVNQNIQLRVAKNLGGNCGTGNQANVQINYSALPTVSAGPTQNVCISGGTVSLTGASPSGGTWSGVGVSSNSFNPSITGAGSFTVSYSYTNPTTGCSASSSKTVVVGPVVTVNNMYSCSTNNSFPLTASISGGTWSGNFVNSTNRTFNAEQAGAGAHVVTYTYVSGGCTVVKNAVVTVGNEAPLQFPYNLSSTSACAGSGSVVLSIDELTGANGGGIEAGGNISFVQWYDQNQNVLVDGGGNPVRSNAIVTTSTQTYYVRAVTNTGCYSMAAPIAGSFIALPTTPVVINGRNCATGGGTIEITSPQSGVVYEWASGGQILDPMVITSGNLNYYFSGPGNSILTVSGISTNQDVDFTITPRTLNGNCQGATVTAKIVYFAPPIVSAGPTQNVCINGGTVPLTGASPSGGTWSGVGVSSNSFNPSITGAGSFTVSYSYTSPTTGCSASSSKAVVVGPAVTVNNMYSCSTNNSFPLTASISGGTWSGNFVNSTNKTFNAEQAGAGTHAVTYTYVSGGCTVVKNAVVTVGNEAPLQFPYNLSSTSACAGSGSVVLSIDELTGANGGGIEAGGNISFVQWYDQNQNVLVDGGGNPVRSNAIVTTSTQTYYVRAVTNAGCYSMAAPIAGSFVALPTTPAVINGRNCATGGGTIEITSPQSGVVYEWASGGQILDPMVITSGNLNHYFTGPGNSILTVSGISTNQDVDFTITPRTLNGNCQGATVTAKIVYFAPPIVSAGSTQNVCISGGTVLLTGASPSGGTWSGAGVSSNNFNPSITGAGSFTVSYSYTSPTTGCSASSSKTVVVGPAVTVNNMYSCSTNNSFPLTASISGGTWSGNFVNPANKTFNAEQAGAGTYAVTYTYVSGGCTVIKNAVVTVGNEAPLQFPYNLSSTSACEGSGSVVLSIDELTGANGGGIEAGGNISFVQWYDQNQNILVDGGGNPVRSNAIVTTSTQTYYVRAVTNAGCYSMAAPIAGSFIALPTTPVVINGRNCATGGGTIEITSPQSGVVYEWASGGQVLDPMVLGSGSLNYYFTGPGNSMLTVSGISTNQDVDFTITPRTLNGNCYGPTVTALVEFFLPPTEITTPDVVKCGPGTAMLTASGTGLINFDWRRSTAPSIVWKNGASVESDFITSSQVYTVIGYDANGCSISDNVNVNYSDLPPPPQAANREFCSFEYATLEAQVDEILSAEWYTVNGSESLQSGLKLTLEPFYQTGTFSYEVASVNLLGCKSTRVQAAIVVPENCDHRINWIKTTSFDATGINEIASSKSYFDDSGQMMQSQSKSYARGEATIFASQALRDRYDRVAGSTMSAPITSTDFNYNPLFNPSLLGNPYGAADFDNILTNTILNPLPVANNLPGTLGWYYSANNTLEENVPVTSYPYSRTEFYEDGSGEVKRAASPGDQHRLGAGHEQWSGTFPLFNELEKYLELDTAVWPGQPELTSIEGIQQVMRDENGQFAVSITDKGGKVLVSGKFATSENKVLTINNTATCSTVSERPQVYFYLTHPQIITISAASGEFELVNTITDEIITDISQALPIGFYKLTETEGNPVAVSFVSFLKDVSYAYYDNVGRLKVSVSPNGVKALNSGTAYSLIDKTTYTYNHRGWLLSMTEPDAGTTRYQYRKDGKIRFSQNAEQALNNWFSYTHYDELGRPIESGEYRGDGHSYPMPLTELEISQNFENEDKKDWIKTHYDEQAIDSAQIGNLAATYQQDYVRNAVSWTENQNNRTWYSYDEFGRLTWMIQRPLAMDQHLFVTSYTYDFLGNVLTTVTSDYNLSGNLLSSFYHHYQYDADQRLIKVHTSLDGTHEELQASYFYYLHGPLKRIEIGKNIQGIDFTYNINGWLTGINADRNNNDPGQDGGVEGEHSSFRKDAFKLALDYYESTATKTASVSINHKDPKEFHKLPVADGKKTWEVSLNPAFDKTSVLAALEEEKSSVLETAPLNPYDISALEKVDFMPSDTLPGEDVIYNEATEIDFYAQDPMTADHSLTASLSPAAGLVLTEGLIPDAIEYAALKDFFLALGGEAWTTKTNWPTGTWPELVTNDVFRNWYGITVTNGDVTSITFGSNNIVGTLPNSISQLQRLSVFNIIENTGLTGTIPITLGSLQHLTTLYFYKTSINGSIPSEIFSAPKLKILVLAYNSLAGTIPIEIGNAVLVERMELNNNQLSGPIPSTIGNLSNVKTLFLYNCALSGSIPAEIGQLVNLDYLRLDYNQLTGSIPQELGNLVNLGSGLFLNNNLLSGSIPASLGNLTKLRTLYLYTNNLSGAIPPELGNMTALTNLRLQTNKLTGSIPTSLGSLSKLVYLHLNGNLLTGEIPEELGKLSNLLQLYLQINTLTGSIPSTLGNLSRLINLSLDANQLSGELPSELGQLTALQFLTLTTNKFSGAIPNSFKNLKALNVISIYGNQFTGELDPQFFENWTNLTQLVIHQNKFSGAIPSTISQLQKLTNLNAGYNQFTEIPASIVQLPLTTSINFDYNLLENLPDLTTHPNKSNISWFVRGNYLDASDFDPYFTAVNTPIYKGFVIASQRVKPEVKLAIPAGEPLEINAHAISPNCTLIWEKFMNGSYWSTVSSSNQSADPLKFLINNPTAANTGKYRYRINNPKFASMYPGPTNEVILVDALNEAPPQALFNGLISAARWNTLEAYASEQGNLKGMYQYTYDDKYQIKDAVWHNVSNDLNLYASTGNNTYRLSGMQYDANGNIQALKRYDKNGLYQHNFNYNYKPNANQLTAIAGYTDSYTYNSIGQLTFENRSGGDAGDKFIVYDVSGKVLRVYTRTTTATAVNHETEPLAGTQDDIVPDGYKLEVYYLYDDRGFRLAKVNRETWEKTWYIRDASGTLLSVYEEREDIPAALTEVPIYGAGKLGNYYPQQAGTIAYELTDHLGNVRAIVKKQVTEYLATMEDNGQTDLSNPRVQEMQAFENLFETAKRDQRFNHTPIEGAEYSAYLHWINGMTGIEAKDKAIGPALALKVEAGDTLTMETWARFKRKASFNRDLTIGLLASFLGGSFAYAPGFEGNLPAQVADELDDLLASGGLFNDTDDTRPYAYLNYMVLDEQMQVVDQNWVRVGDDAGFWAGEEGLTNRHKRISFDQPVITTAKGYVYIWVSNLSQDAEVWFDDVKVRHTQTIVAQATDYGVWGDVLREQKSNSLEQYRFGYQGQFAEKDEETGWNHFELREYDAVIGRWLVPDPMSQYWSPYVGMGNNPVNLVDPDGGFTDPKIGDVKGNQIFTEGGWMEMLDEVTVSALKFDASANRIEVAMRYLGSYTYKQGRAKDGKFLDDKFMDCSEFVLRVLKESDPDIYKKLITTEKGGYLNQNTATIQLQIKAHGGSFRKDNPKVGDLIMWGGHIEIIKTTNGEYFTTIGAGGGTGAVVPRLMGKSKQGYNWLHTGHKDIGTLGIGGYLGIWTPK